MKHLFAVLGFSCLGALSSFGGESAAKTTVTNLAWLAGTWRMEAGGRQITEHWLPPAGGTMLGMSRTVARGKTVEYEFIVLREEANGDVNYVAKPSGQAEAAFKIIRASSTEVVFENPQHDFPQRIIYTLKDGGKLTATIEGTKDGKTRRVEFNYQRAEP